MGRRWLDVARYAESSGKDVNVAYPFAWRYRDYVVDAFNQDMPFDRFIQEQIAGDLLRSGNKEAAAKQTIATGFLAMGAKSLSEQNQRQFAVDVADEQIDTVSQAFLAVTIACARCHDHKFDPVSQRDYTAMAGIFCQLKRTTELLVLLVAEIARPLSNYRKSFAMIWHRLFLAKINTTNSRRD